MAADLAVTRRHVVVDMPGDEIQLGTRCPAFLQEWFHPLCERIGHCGPPDPGLREDRPNGLYVRSIVGVVVIDRVDQHRATTILSDVGFVANFPISHDWEVNRVSLCHCGDNLLPLSWIGRLPDLLVNVREQWWRLDGQGCNHLRPGRLQRPHIWIGFGPVESSRGRIDIEVFLHEGAKQRQLEEPSAFNDTGGEGFRVDPPVTQAVPLPFEGAQDLSCVDCDIDPGERIEPGIYRLAGGRGRLRQRCRRMTSSGCEASLRYEGRHNSRSR